MGKTILSNINLQIPQGQCWAIIGPSGSGKTTLFKTINTLIKPLKGSLKLIDIPVDSKKNTIDSYLECLPGAPVFKGLRERNAVSN